MTAKLDPVLLRATSAEHALESGAHPRLEPVVEDPAGAVSYASMRWERLDRGKELIVLASSPALDRVGVTTHYAGKYVSYHECSPEQAKEAIGNFQRVGFSGPKQFGVKP